MKKLVSITLVLLLALTLCVTCLAEEGINWDALLEGAPATEAATEAAEQTVAVTAQDTGGAFDWSDIITKIIVWALGLVGTVLSALLGWVFKKYIFPWLRDVAIPWLKQKKLLKAAQTAVEYAEATIGRHNGLIKWDLAEEMLGKLGYDINSAEVVAAAKAAWMQLDISQYAAGIKQAITEEKPPDTPEQADTFADTDAPVSGL